MHLLVDVRTSSISDISAIIYAECWVSLWKDISPHDRITFLAYDGDPLISDDIIRIPRPGFLHLQKKIAHHANGPKRIISFSRLPSIDRSIPSITHISDIAPLLYPYQIGGFLMRKKLIHAYKKMLRRSQMIIVPENGIRSDISEFFGIEDSRITVIPYLSETSMSLHHDSMKVTHGLERRYLITEGTPGNEWNPIGLIRAYAEYIQRHGGTEKLIIIGDMGENLGHITSLIRSLELIQEIKLIGIPTEEERKTLYAHASGWIYIWPYYSGSYSMSLALGSGLPLILSDIESLGWYAWVRIHPNHTDILPGILKEHEWIKKHTEYHSKNEAIMEVYRKIIAL